METLTPFWPWLSLLALGAFHGLNPAMGWLFAVALGLLHPKESVAVFRTEIASATAASSPMRVVSSQTALVLLGEMAESKAPLIDWSMNDRDYAILAAQVVKEHWKFWSSLRK